MNGYSRLHAGARTGWRNETDAPRSVLANPSSTMAAGPMPPVDRALDDALDIQRARQAGITKAIGYLGSTAGTPTYRRTRALLAVCRAVETQAKIAGLGHLHVGTVPCGPACEWPDWQRGGAPGVTR